ncbi:lysozyme [Sphingomicrobium sp. XHP0239]|uniref:lysozyme n=1 Tax=Sphingomicrobium maritimum TaxID=3133972 RepID=UPI0031CC8690
MTKGIPGTAIAAMLAIATPQVAQHEGLRLEPYRDVIGVPTVCYGETRVEMRAYSKVECDALLAKALRNDFGLRVASSAPGIWTQPYEWAAHTSLTFNIGLGAYRKSSVLRLYREGKPVEACRFMRRYRFAGGRVIQGLVNRREGHGATIGEYELCLVGAIPRQIGGDRS